ncbi:hypothetical protein FRC96_17120 [Lujinxingia vulgaris]|uniref:Class I SAM-dependent methyltransferase n=1 Tax=Lujinxingia vulgaris TaxID=2600176 RepID=A0A5C6X2L4_9DELT|nr:hypothetical protein [Lujinxingia vulgaris]TXD32560.1 hypothetical protein FRC96_17120 [Lujinxingia vulgaris]
MQRRHYFEFEDKSWLPGWLRECMTLYIAVIHRMLGSQAVLAPLVERALEASPRPRVVDLCSGAGGPMPQVIEALREQGREDVELVLTDLYPNELAARRLSEEAQGVRYEERSIDATAVPGELGGVRTIVCGLHHMRPAQARGILEDAWQKRQPFVAFELSDNSAPFALWWTAIPFGFLMTLALTPFVRPLTLRQLIFTYLIPVLPVLIAWDGAVSNVRTYTEEDLGELLSGAQSDDYRWEIGTASSARGPGKMLYVLGLPRVLG